MSASPALRVVSDSDPSEAVSRATPPKGADLADWNEALPDRVTPEERLGILLKAVAEAPIIDLNNPGPALAASAAELPPEANAPRGSAGSGPSEKGLDADLAEFHRTDLGNSERLVERFGDDLKHIEPWHKWMTWDGRRWAVGDTARAMQLAKQTVRMMLAEASTIKDDDKCKAHTSWAFASEAKSRIESMLKLASSDERVSIGSDRIGSLDADPWVLNVANGTIDLRTGSIRRHRREDLMARLCPTPFDPTAKCPLWLQTMSLVFGADEELMGFWQRLCGYLLTGTTGEQCLPICHGSGQNGKSTILNALMAMLGTDYATKAPSNLLMVRRTEQHPTELANLHGKRLVAAIETEQGARINESLVKELTGSDPITCRRMREDFWTFNPTHKVILSTNHKPQIRGTDHAIWRRILLVPFNVAIPADQLDKSMPERLARESSGVLAWCVRGCLEWQKMGGLVPPKIVTASTDRYKSDQDTLAQFIEDRCFLHSSTKARAGEIWEEYKDWADKSAFLKSEVLSHRTFADSLVERGFEKRTSNGVWYLGIGLRQLPTSEKQS